MTAILIPSIGSPSESTTLPKILGVVWLRLAQLESNNVEIRIILNDHFINHPCVAPNGLRYLRWGGDGEAVQPEKGYGVENCLGFAQNPQRQVHALLGGVIVTTTVLKRIPLF